MSHFGNFTTAIDGVNTVETQMADNDYAVGLLIEKVANSKYKDSTLIFVVEDDAQNGGDHVDAHRSIARSGCAPDVWQFDPRTLVTYTRVVRRLMAILLGVALASTAGQVSALHTHAYTDHDHPEHHHGLASHEHHAVETHSAHDAASLEPCDPGRHAVSLILGSEALTHLHTLSAECGTTASIEPLVPLHSVTMLRDVRVHGPPPHAQAAPRAPPLTPHA